MGTSRLSYVSVIAQVGKRGQGNIVMERVGQGVGVPTAKTKIRQRDPILRELTVATAV